MNKRIKIGKLPNWVYRSVINSKSVDLMNCINIFMNTDFEYTILEEGENIVIRSSYDNAEDTSSIIKLIEYILKGISDPYTGFRTQNGGYKWYEEIDDNFSFEISTETNSYKFNDVVFASLINLDHCIFNGTSAIDIVFNIKEVRKDPSDNTSRTITDILTFN